MRLNNERLTGPQIDEFKKAIRDAFNDEQEFKQFLLFQFNKSLDDITPKDTFPTQIFNVIKVAETEDWTEELLRAARLWRPTNTQLLTFAEQFGLALSTPPERELKSVFERMVRPNSKVVDPAVWREKLERIEGQVCRVEVRDGGESTFGTGFLLGPDVVITNYHIVKDVIKGDVGSKNVTFLFDFKKTVDASLPGIPYYLAERDWCIDYSEPSPLDEVIEPWDKAPDEDKLDYALLRLSTRAGEERIGGEANKNPNATLRGWITVSTIDSQLLPDLELFIMQHKDGDRLKLAPDTHSIIRTNVNNTRVFYKTYTDEGSSGASCFDIDWQLVALHQGGDKRDKPEYNQGIPFSAIVKLLKKRGKLGSLDIAQNKESSNQHSKDSSSKQESTSMESYNKKPEAGELTAYDHACKHFREAAACLQKACEPFHEKFYIPPTIFRTSIQNLQEMQVHIQEVIECLQNPSSLPPSIAQEVLDIIHNLRKVHINVEQPLLSNLFQHRIGNFEPIIHLMHTIEQKLLPDHSASHMRDTTTKELGAL